MLLSSDPKPLKFCARGISNPWRGGHCQLSSCSLSSWGVQVPAAAQPGLLLQLLAAALGQGLGESISLSSQSPSHAGRVLESSLGLYFPPVCRVAPGAPQLAEVLVGNGALIWVSEPAGQFMAFSLHRAPGSTPLPQPPWCAQRCGRAVHVRVVQKQLVKAQLGAAAGRSHCYLLVMCMTWVWFNTQSELCVSHTDR